ncbi:MAG: hypothetical protein KDA91_21255 [Planctomycetaceae bacterium]|nr:hypothetical protein [Planctomycetaceae bacterium]
MREDRRRGRELLRTWIEQFDGQIQEELFETVCDQLLGELGGPNTNQACMTLSMLGFRSARLSDHLWSALEEANNDQGWRFLNCLIDCGEPPSDRLWSAFTALRDGRQPYSVASTLRRIGDPRRSEVMPQLVAQLTEENHAHGLQFGLAAWAETTSIDTGDDVSAFEAVWATAKHHPMMVLLDRRIGPALDCPSIIPEIVNWVESLTQIEDDSFRVWRVHHGLKGCYGERQLASWINALNQNSTELALRLATSDAGKSSVSRTPQSEAKLFACRMLLMSGCEYISEVLEGCYADEEWFLQRDIARISRCIQLTPLPQFVRDRIEGEFDNTGSDSNEFAKRDAALHVALSNGTREAFDTMLNFGYTYQGQVLLDWTQTLSSLAYDLCRRGDKEIVDALQMRLSADQKTQHREAVSRVFSFLGGRRLLDKSVISTVLKGVLDEDLPDYARADLVNSLHTFEFDQGDETIPIISQIAFSTDQPNLRLESCAFLIRQGYWSDYIDQFWQLIEWGNAVEIPASPDDQIEDWKCIIVAELFLADPTRFTTAMEFVLSHCNDDVCSRICRSLRRGKVFPNSIVDCLTDRLIRGTNPFTSPAYLFAALGHMDPHRLISDQVWEHRDDWIIGAKIGCIDAIREVDGQNELFDHGRIARLDALCGDSAVAVRHAANGAILALSPDGELMTELFKSRADVKQPLWRHLLAAETIEFLPKSVRMGDEGLEQIKYHRFRQVREQVEVSLKAARQRDNAAHCRAELLTMKSGTNAEVLKLFAYGDALSNIGDLEDLRVVRDFLIQHQDLQINARAWLQDIIDQIAKRFKSNDHDISLGWNAIYESFEGVLSTTVGELDANFNLWRQPAANYREPGTWGGTAVLNEELRMDKIFKISDATINADERVAGYVVVSRIQGTIVNLNGSGAYPLRNSTADR